MKTSLGNKKNVNHFLDISPDKRISTLQLDIHPGAELSTIIQQEQERSDRSGHIFSKLTFACQNLEDAVILKLWRVVRNRIRCIDEVGWLPDTNLALILPYTSAEGAWALAEEISQLMQLSQSTLDCKVYVYPSEKQKQVS